jgi:long-subunit fatty acid transport protein
VSRALAAPSSSGATAKRALLVLLATSALLALIPRKAQAGGFFLPGRGVVPQGRASAFVASSAGDLNALTYNPANIATLGEFRLAIDANLIEANFRFSRAPRTMENGEVVTYPTVRDQAAPLPNPQVMVGGSITENLKWGFGLHPPNFSPLTFPTDGPQRYVLIDNNGSLMGLLNFVLAYKFGDDIRVGLGLQNWIVDLVVVNMGSGYTGLFGDPEDRDLDILTRINLVSYFNPTATAGVWLRLAEFLEAGLSLQLPTRVRDRNAALEVRLPDHPAFDDARVEGDSVDGSLAFPFIARLGLRYVAESFDYELAFVFEGWSIFDEISATPNDVRVENVRGLDSIPVAPLSIPMEYRDTFSIRNGASLALDEKLVVRAGYAYETPTIPDERYSVFLPDGHKHLFTAGGSYDFGALDLDLGLAFLHIPTREITNSEVRQINPADTDDELATVVGNGTYRQHFWMIGIGAEYVF